MTNESQSLLWLKGKNNLFNKRNMPASLLSSWDKHVTSWTADNLKFPLLIIKFEDLVYEKEKTLRVIANFFINEYKFKFQNLDQKINNILKTTSFDNLKNQEIKSGFIEAQEGRQFFKTGKKNQWINKLDKDQIYKIEEKFKVVMNKFNYK